MNFQFLSQLMIVTLVLLDFVFPLRPSFSGFVFEMLPIRIEVCICRSLCLSLLIINVSLERIFISHL